MKTGNELAIGVDCGGTNLKLAVVNKAGELIRSEEQPINYKSAPEKVVRDLAKRIKTFAKSFGLKKVRGVGLGIAGDIDHEKGMVRFSPNMNWKNVSVRDVLSKEMQMQVLIENDANCAAWGAYHLDAKKDCDHLICLTLGTGIGGGIILNGKLYRGCTGSAGEIGHMTVRYDGRPCRCGNFGCLESMVGAWGLIATAEAGLKKGLAPALRKILQSSLKKNVSPETIAAAALRGDPYCQQIWKDAGEILGSALSNCVNIFNPERIVLCGGVSKAGPLLLEPMIHTLGRRAFATPAQKVKVSVSKFEERLGVAGAALLTWEQ